jgi:hypothetical protein
MASKRLRRVLIGAGVVVAGWAALHAVNYARLDAGALRANVEPILAEARALGEKAKPEYQELALATLPPNPRTGSYFRLDDMLDRAVVKQAPPAATVDNAVIQALEFDDPESPELVAAGEDGAAIAVRDGALEVVNEPDDYLVNAVPLDVPRDDVGDILIRARADKGSYLRLAWATAEGPRGGRAAGRNIWLRRIDVRFNDTKGFHTYVVNARNCSSAG